MEFSDMLKRCKLSEISDFLLGLDKCLIEKDDTDYETAIINMEHNTEILINSRFENTDDREIFYNEIARRDSVIRETYFQLGFIAGINVAKDFGKRAKELHK